MADFDLDMRIKALVEGAREVHELAEELRDVRQQGQKDIPDNTERLRQGMRQTKKQTDLATTGMRALRGAIVAVGGAAAVYMGVRAAGSIIQAGLATERLERGFGAVTASSKEAREEMEFVRGVANKYGGNLERLARDYLSLTAAARGTNLEGDQTRQIFLGIVEASTALGLSADATSGSLTAIQQIMSKGVVSAEELRQQLGERLYGAFQAASKAMGVSTRELGEMLQNGEVMADDLLPKLARELRNTYGQAAAESTDSAQAAFGRFQTLLFDLKAELSEDLMPAMIEAVEDLRDALQDEGVREGLSTLVKAMATLATTTAAAAANTANFLNWVGESFASIFEGVSSDDIVRIEERIRHLRELRDEMKGTAAEETDFYKQVTADLIRYNNMAADYYARQSKMARDKDDSPTKIEIIGDGGGDGGGGSSGGGGKEVEAPYRFRGVRAAVPGQRSEAELALEEAKEWWREYNEQAEESSKQMSEFAIQAARNMQSSFADFFFDPMEEGFEGLLLSFRDILRRMVAEMAAQELLTGIAKSAWGQSMGMGALIEHGGGIARPYGGMQRTGVSPLAFAGAARFHQGGEVPAILQQGEEVLTADDPRHARNGGGGGGNVSVQVVNNGTPQEVEGQPSLEMTPEGLVVSVLLRDQERNGPVTRGFRGVFGGGRRGGGTGS